MHKDQKRRARRSPIKSFIRPRPGAVPREMLLDKYDGLFYWAVCAVLLTVAVATILLFDWLWPKHLFTLYAGLVGGSWMGLAYFVWRNRRAIRNLRLAVAGECEVAQILDELRDHGYQVVHSIRCKRFDIDHAVIGPSGVYTVETKTISKRGGPEEQVHWDGKSIRASNSTLDRDPVTQALAQARTLRKIIADYTGEMVSVQPTVVFPGWLVVNKVGRSDLWVENPSQLVKRILNAPERPLERRDIRRFTNALYRYQHDEERRRLKMDN